MNWSPAHQAMLAAMGYTLHARATPAASLPAEAASAGVAPGREEGSPSADRRDAGPARADRLMQALQRASRGRRIDAMLPPLEQLRASPAAKRAFWPVLKALRRG